MMDKNTDPFDDDDVPLESLSDELMMSDPVGGNIEWDEESELTGPLTVDDTVDQEEEAAPSTLMDDTVLVQEAERQEISNYKRTVAERDRIIEELEEGQQFLEDELEDANTEIDRLRRELDKLAVEAEEAEFQRREAEGARKQVESSLYEIREGVEHAKATDLRDSRMHRSKRAVGINLVTLWPLLKGLLGGMVAGAVLLIVVFEILLWLNDKPELFQLLFG
ncbi:MAG: hypothetical protein ACWA5Q_03945 [bacterium]